MAVVPELSHTYRELGEAAWSWVFDHVCEDDGPWLPAAVSDDWRHTPPADDRDSLYSGIAGLAPILAEIALHRSLTDTELDLSTRVAARLGAKANVRTEPSLYDGLASDLTALKLLAPGPDSVALQRLTDLMPRQAGTPRSRSIQDPMRH
ncbi:MAG TPA: hypothetical protein DGT23_16630 [Micromonosporaceae bacterium]|nr:hypothetical protein [Micromonosporaceae bacterium]